MPWVGLSKVCIRGAYKNLVLRVEDTQGPGCLLRLYDGEVIVAEATADDPHVAIQELVQAARRHLGDESITTDSFNWVQM
jgi:hypothetical protein